MSPLNSTTFAPESLHLQATPARRTRTARRPPATLSVTLALACGLAGCASLPPGSQRDPRDHAERFNRAMFKFNTTVDHAVLRPVARGYVKVTPQPVRTSISNFMGNLKYTKTIGNDLFQGQFRDFGSDIGRFVVNTTVGVAGLFDPATRIGLEKHDRDFGQTLGKWGLPTGTYLMLPILGPSDVRDGLGLVPDRFMSLDGYINNAPAQAGLTVTSAVDGRSKLLPFDKALDTAYDPYALVRNVWFQKRDQKVHGDTAPEVLLPGPDDE
jgi:phospholipid-binding lipoprotein MlaA